MAPDRLIAVCLMYRDLLKQKGFAPMRDLNATIYVQRSEHLAWMCVETVKLVEEGRIEKAFRWLGFIQGALWADGHRTIDAMRLDNTDATSEKDRL